MRIGYYIFFGYGDYHPSSSNSKIWVNAWDVERWKQFIDELVELDVNTLMIYLNGHTLPYQSKKYPSLVDYKHPNCQKEFLTELLSYIKGKNIDLIGVITTTGHAGKFAELNPETVIEISNQDTAIEKTLISFPDHLKKDKLAKKEGAAQLGYGVLCHNKLSAQKYTEDIISEIISMYGDFFDGIALHPPESAYPCECSLCQERFSKEYGEGVTKVDVEKMRQFFITSYLAVQNERFFPLIRNQLSKCKLLLFTIPWLFESSFNLISPLINKDTVIIDWDYNLDSERIKTLRTRLDKYMSLGNEVWFMPTAGFSFNSDSSIDEQVSSVHEQIEIAENVGVKGVVHFLGPKTSDYIFETSVKSLLNRNSQYLPGSC